MIAEFRKSKIGVGYLVDVYDERLGWVSTCFYRSKKKAESRVREITQARPKKESEGVYG